LAEATGISLRTIQRLERGEFDNPPLRYLVNCQLALGVERLEELLEEEWLSWKVFDVAASEPPPPGWPDAPSARWNQSPHSPIRKRSRERRRAR
jgi:transcriptional regulator with XRE-family HTH domain